MPTYAPFTGNTRLFLYSISLIKGFSGCYLLIKILPMALLFTIFMGIGNNLAVQKGKMM